MLSIPTVAQMLTVIGLALLATIVIVAVVGYLLQLVEQRSQTAAVGTHPRPEPAPVSNGTVPVQRTASTGIHRVPAGTR